MTGSSATLFGIDRLVDQAPGDYCYALVGHPASVSVNGQHTVDRLQQAGFNLVLAFGPQHGMRGDKQDNMIESPDYVDAATGIPVLSLYGEHRRPTEEMLQGVDIVLFDLQDVGCRIYTYISTLKYFLELCSRLNKPLWILDRPNPAGRPVDGLILEEGQQSFVGCDLLPTRHGLTVGELGQWFVWKNRLDVDLQVFRMTNYHINGADLGWPRELPWINPSPNASSVNMARCFAGTVLLEGTQLSEGRGTTTPLELIGAPDFPVGDVLEVLRGQSSDWTSGALLRSCFFEPTFHKHMGELCQGLQIPTSGPQYQHDTFRPYCLIAGMLKALKQIDPHYPLWRHHDYEYELDRIPIDVINGGPFLKNWVDAPSDWDALLDRVNADCQTWRNEREAFLLYA
jgi:uncharacterized protein YbbC (DUF1343 family)